MAIWQYGFHLLPQEELSNVGSLNLIPDEDGLWDFDKLWGDRKLPKGYEEFLDSRIRKCNSWHHDIKCWGDYSANIIEIVFADRRIDDIHFRVDVSSLDFAFIESVVQFAQLCDCRLLTQEHAVIDANLEGVVAAIKDRKRGLHKRPRSFT